MRAKAGRWCSLFGLPKRRHFPGLLALLLFILTLASPAAAQVTPQDAALAKMFDASKQKLVIVLGNYADGELNTLMAVRDALRNKGYDAELIKDLPEIDPMTNEEKVRLWTMAAKFSVMVDKLPAGNIAEYEFLKQDRSIMALMRPVRTGSTWMIGDDPWVDINYFKLFQFENTPVSQLDNAIAWAEGMVKKRTEGYNAGYPWRPKPAKPETTPKEIQPFSSAQPSTPNPPTQLNPSNQITFPAPPPPTALSSATTSSSQREGLPFTGGDAAMYALYGLVPALSGAGLVTRGIVRRRRKG